MFDPSRYMGSNSGSVSGAGTDVSTSLAGEEAQKKKAATQQIERWALAMIESETIRNACIISVQEVVCGDPTCAPIDTVIVFTFEEGGQGMIQLPMSPVEVTEEILKEVFPPGEIFEKWMRGEEAKWPPEPEPVEVRFDIGFEVLCRVGPQDWIPGKITQLWYHEPTWPEWVYAPYKILLDDGRSIFAPQDNDQIIKLNPASTINEQLIRQMQLDTE